MAAFLAFGALALLAALMVVLNRNPVVSALWLAVTLAASAGIFLLLDAEFLAVIQLIIYAGAIMVFFLFVVMLLNVGELAPAENRRPLQRFFAVWGALALGLLLVFALKLAGIGGAEPGGELVAGRTRALAELLFSRYLAPFELVSLTLLIAMVGAVVLAKRRV